MIIGEPTVEPMSQLAGILTEGLADRYRIERELGRGGMATVYLARDLRYDRPVAVKVLLPDLASAVGSQRFLREIRIAASLRHPNILPVLDSGDVEGLPFYVMPFVEGESLREKLLREKQLPIPEAIQVGREVADALAYAHEKGVVHRDIKPANIMLDSGHAVVADFGIALAMQPSDSGRLTATGVSPGAPHYMSPEQAAGEGDVDGRSDVYSLGCVLYEMLAGDPPFTGRMSQAILAKKLTETPPPLRAARDTVPLPLERVVARSLARTPADRFRTAREFQEALDALASGHTVDTGPVEASWGDVAGRAITFRWVATVAGASAAVLGLATAVGFVTTRIYDLKLGIPADFSPSRTDFPIVGIQALVPVLFYAFVAILAYVIFGQTWRLATYGLRRAPAVGDTLESLRRSTSEAWRDTVSAMSSTAVADLFFISVVAAGLLALAPFRELFTSLWSEGTEALSSANRDLHKRYTLVLTLVILALLFTWRGVFRHLRERGPLATRVLVSKWASLASILVLVMVVTAPWRLLWSNFHERVLLEGERAYVLMETDSEFVIYRPGTRSTRRYGKTEDLNLERLGTAGYVFEQPATFESGGAVGEGS
jgi:hypothetical protein